MEVTAGMVAAAVLGTLAVTFLTAWLTPTRRATTTEIIFFKDEKGAKRAFPTIYQPSEVSLSVVFPSYNEEKRLAQTLDLTVAALNAMSADRPKFTWEIVIVDDGSADQTSAVGQRYTASLGSDRVRVMTLADNIGKGGAVNMGMLRSRGDHILFADADGATSASDIARLYDALLKAERDDLGVAIGSRAHLVDTDVVIQRSALRNLLMNVFHILVSILGVSGIRDTQCGFKMFSRRSARHIFERVNVEGWIFDIEVLLLAQLNDMPIVEMPVNWHEVAGSKMSIMRDSILMLKDLLIIRYNYTFGYWRAD